MNEYVYIYNIAQANYYIQNGIQPVGVDIVRSTGRVYLKFIKEDTSEVYGEWLTICKSIIRSEKYEK